MSGLAKQRKLQIQISTLHRSEEIVRGSHSQHSFRHKPNNIDLAQVNCARTFFRLPFVFEGSWQPPSPKCREHHEPGFAGDRPSAVTMAGCLPSRHTHNEHKQKVERLVEAMQAKSIKLLALDFDLTFIDIHTHGEWYSSVDELVSHVRPCMRDLLQHAHTKGMFVCIVTFHPWPWLIREVISKVYPKKIAKHIYVQAMPHSQVRANGGAFTGKVQHIHSVLEEIMKDAGVQIDKRQVFLLDDDMTNVSTAISQGHRSMQLQVVDKAVDYETLDSFERMLRIGG